MAERKKGSVVIVDGERPIGILTERDLVRFNATGAAAADTKVSEWMTQPVDCAAPDLSVQEAFHEFAEHGYRHLPVVDDGKLVGVVSLRALMDVAQIQPVVHPSTIEAPPGLEGVIVAETSVGDVRGLEGFYHYRQYNAVELADKLPLEDVWHLLFEGHLPSAAEREAFAAEVNPLARRAAVGRRAPARPGRVEPDGDGGRAVGHVDGRRRRGLQAHARHRPGRAPSQRPADVRGDAHADHGDPPPPAGPASRSPPGRTSATAPTTSGCSPARSSTRTSAGPSSSTRSPRSTTASTPRPSPSRVICSSGADVAAAVVGGMGALSGPLHGGAPSRALALLEAIGTVDNARPYLIDHVTRGEKIMGFGHRVYKTNDPRSEFLRGVAERIQADKVEFAKVVEQTVVDVLAELKPGRNLYANVEFYAGVVMDHCGLPPRAVHAHVRVEPRHRLVRQHPRAGRRQPDHPPVGQVRRPAAAPARPRPELSVPVTVTIATAGRRRGAARRAAAPRAAAVAVQPAAVARRGAGHAHPRLR